MKDKNLIIDSVNNLLSLIIEKSLYEKTEDLKDSPFSRIQKCILITNNQISLAVSLESDCVPDAKRMITISQKKLNNLKSLSVLAERLEI
tara:strand:- start:333 stop:602 length:270 start_codon:yes stop_codon:yes gene_type:complete